VGTTDAYLLLSMTCNYLDAMEMNWGEKGKGERGKTGDLHGQLDQEAFSSDNWIGDLPSTHPGPSLRPFAHQTARSGACIDLAG
jgi:hypothetical protein